jgi:hypothetical protein
MRQVPLGRSFFTFGKDFPVDVIPWGEKFNLKHGKCWVVSYNEFELVDEAKISSLHKGRKLFLSG